LIIFIIFIIFTIFTIFIMFRFIFIILIILIIFIISIISLILNHILAVSGAGQLLLAWRVPLSCGVRAGRSGDARAPGKEGL
jgi:hypothetical protein